MKSFYFKNCIAALALFLVGCDSILDVSPPSSITIDSFFKSEDDARSATNGMYYQLRGLSTSVYTYGDERTDLVDQAPDLGAGSDVNRNTIQVTTGGTDWGGFYALLKDVNLVIAKVPDIEFKNQNEKNDILAQAYFVRAWTYFMIARIWGDAPLLTAPIESPNQDGILPAQRDPVSALFGQIKSDIDQSLSLFSDDGVGSRYKASKPAANMLKADVYLWTAKQEGGGDADLNTALSAVNEIIGHPDFELLTDYASIFRPTTATNEDIFSIYRDVVENNGGFFAGRFNLSDSFWNALSDEDKARVPFISGSVRFYIVTDVFANLITANSNGNTDAREALYFLPYTDGSGLTRTVLNKYQGTETSANVNEFTDDVKIYRYADALLIRAEIQNALGATPSAVDDLNLIRNRAGIGDYAGGLSEQEVDDAILQERAVEFGFEGKRWWDLVRFGKAYDLVPSLAGKEGQQPILWPISLNTLSLNPNLSQTLGY